MSKPKAKISYTKTIGKSSVLVGISWSGIHDVNDFRIEEFGKVEATGTEQEDRKFGWAVYEEFFGKVDDVVEIRETDSDQ